VHGVSHITGGGFYENIPRSIPEGLCARIRKSDVRVLPIFRLLQETGNIPERDMYNTYNMGVGMVVIVSKETAEAAQAALRENGVDAYVLGEIVESKNGEQVELW
ncbi:MAG: AIR synthase-related protein, partial [Butyricicoccaceae bacterium]